MTSEYDKMVRGDLYNGADPALIAARNRARSLWQRYNAYAPDDPRRDATLRELLGNVGANVVIEMPFYCDYGNQVSLGDGVFVNMNCMFLDVAAIVIGSQTFLGPSVQLYTATHPLDAKERVAGLESAKPIVIGSRVWIGGATVVCPGVTIGDDTTIGAGSVVVRDIPSGVLAAGNPCRVIRKL